MKEQHMQRHEAHCDFPAAELSRCAHLIHIVLSTVVPAQGFTLTLAKFQLVFLGVYMMASVL